MLNGVFHHLIRIEFGSCWKTEIHLFTMPTCSWFLFFKGNLTNVKQGTALQFKFHTNDSLL